LTKGSESESTTDSDPWFSCGRPGPPPAQGPGPRWARPVGGLAGDRLGPAEAAGLGAIRDSTVANGQSQLPPSSWSPFLPPPSPLFIDTPSAVTAARPVSRCLTIVTTQPAAASANTANHRKSRKINYLQGTRDPRLQGSNPFLPSTKLQSSPVRSSPVQEGILKLKSFDCHVICHMT
jgi:hypothetical protein